MTISLAEAYAFLAAYDASIDGDLIDYLAEIGTLLDTSAEEAKISVFYSGVGGTAIDLEVNGGANGATFSVPDGDEIFAMTLLMLSPFLGRGGPTAGRRVEGDPDRRGDRCAAVLAGHGADVSGAVQVDLS